MYIEKSIWPETSQPARNPPTHGHHFSSFQRQPQLLRNPNTRTHANPTKKRENGLAIAIPIPKFLISNFLIPNHFSLSLKLKPQESETGNGHHDHEERQYRRRGSSPGHGAADLEEPQCPECTPGSMPHFPGPLFPAVRRIPTPLQGLSTSACSSPRQRSLLALPQRWRRSLLGPIPLKPPSSGTEPSREFSLYNQLY
jgi:hypothetical protein